jgi:ATP-dependent helicase/nuclease subunit B
MAEAIRPSLFTLPFGQDICGATVDAIFDRVGDDPLALSEALILLPNNRAIQSMTEAFVRRAQPGLLLPRLVAVGDLALDEALGPLLDPLDNAQTIDPVIEPMQRLMLLAKLVTKHRAASGDPVNPNEALRLARYLSEVIDELEIEEIRFGRFDEIKPEDDMAGHWQSSYGQLLAMLPEYHAELERRKRLGPAARRNRLLDRLSSRLKDIPPKGFVVAAGISTAAPAIARLLKRIALLPNAMVVLPSIDLEMPDVQWDQLGPHDALEDEFPIRAAHENHPQFHLRLLLNRMGFGREEVQRIGDKLSPEAQEIADIFCLPAATAEWRELPLMRKQLPHIRLMLAEDSSEEARAIAVLLRASLEQPEQRAALVTPDREIAVRVAAQLRRWGISVDDSAGSPLLQTPEGMLIMALADGFANHFAPVSLLAIAKHPLVYNGDGRLEWLEQVRQLDLVLRGPNSGIGFDAVANRISDYIANKRNTDSGVETTLPEFWQGYATTLQAFDATGTALGKASFADITDALQKLASVLTENAIWKGTTGRQLATFFEELAACDTSAIGKPGRSAVPAILTELLSGEVVRPPYGGHPRVAIYGLLEARLQQTDLLICAGLNEGSWPQLPQPDPWLAPRIRRNLGLAAPERNIGLSAHDLATALGAREVILSRAKRDRGGPSVASRFLLRIQAYLGDDLAIEGDAVEFARLLEIPEKPQKVFKPIIMPSAEQRKVDLSVTDFDKLMADPYAFYASKILRLKKLEAVDAEPGYAWRGTIIHDILHLWATDDKCDPDKLEHRIEALLSNPAIHPSLRAMWQPRIAESLRWVAAQTQEMLDEQRKLIVAEADGHVELAGIKIKGRADRIDRLADGSLAIVDYKTGQAPSNKAVKAGFALQLGLIALMAQEGHIKDAAGTVSLFEYWSLTKRSKDGGFGQIKSATALKEKDDKLAAEDFVAFAKTKALEAIQNWITGNEAFTAKLHPEFAPFADYDQLMRLQEWDGREPVDESKVQ